MHNRDNVPLYDQQTWADSRANPFLVTGLHKVAKGKVWFTQKGNYGSVESDSPKLYKLIHCSVLGPMGDWEVVIQRQMDQYTIPAVAERWSALKQRWVRAACPNTTLWRGHLWRVPVGTDWTKNRREEDLTSGVCDITIKGVTLQVGAAIRGKEPPVGARQVTEEGDEGIEMTGKLPTKTRTCPNCNKTLTICECVQYLPKNEEKEDREEEEEEEKEKEPDCSIYLQPDTLMAEAAEKVMGYLPLRVEHPKGVYLTVGYYCTETRKVINWKPLKSWSQSMKLLNKASSIAGYNCSATPGEIISEVTGRDIQGDCFISRHQDLKVAICAYALSAVTGARYYLAPFREDEGIETLPPEKPAVCVKGFQETGQGMADYLYTQEAEDFVEQLGEFRWHDHMEEEGIAEAIRKISRSLNEDTAAQSLEVISKYLPEPPHVLIDVLKFYAMTAPSPKDNE